MGFDIDQEGIIQRYSREKEAWQSHLKLSQNAIIESIKLYKPSTIAILGSGWLLDVPIEFIVHNCTHCYLIDIKHPNQIKHKLSKYNNITIIEDDITGGIARQIWQQYESERTITKLERFDNTMYNLPQKVEMVISLNILNQLDILLCDFITDNSNLTDNEIISFRTSIQSNHIKMLSKQTFCLISDFEETAIDSNNGNSETRKTVLCEFPKTNHSEEWIWNFDSKGYYYPDKHVLFKVKALY